MKLSEIATDDDSLAACASLLKSAFPHTSHMDSRYLKWLYRENPAGEVVGFNAWEDQQIIGHYACIPVDIVLNGMTEKGLLALNTAVHPDYRNAGTIYSLAKKTFTLASAQEFACVYAVANAASTPILTKALGFQLVCQLTATLGFSTLRPDWHKAFSINRFRRQWNAVSAQWRVGNPSNNSYLIPAAEGGTHFKAKTGISGIHAWGSVPIEGEPPHYSKKLTPGINLFLGLYPTNCCRYTGHFSIPERLKPSPLNFVYRPLHERAPTSLERDEIILGTHDFDAY